jgi:bis(5'-nucleosyl)-tetraphosphatase (symmetrical)
LALKTKRGVMPKSKKFPAATDGIFARPPIPVKNSSIHADEGPYNPKILLNISFMTTYAIGDIQGCRKALDTLTRKIGFNPNHDTLWLVGDLVNRGPESLSVLRWAAHLGHAAVTVLGNHDLHLLMVAEGFAKLRRDDTLQDILDAPDRDQLLFWLRQQRLLYAQDNFVLVHAGLLPQWSVAQAQKLAQEVESELHGENYRSLLAHLYGNQPDRWDNDLSSVDRLRIIVNAMTRLRICSAEGLLELRHKGSPHSTPSGFLPWFDVPGRKSRHATVVCGHWSALGLQLREDLIALDTGCLWGGSLTAVRLEDRQVFQVSCRG